MLHEYRDIISKIKVEDAHFAAIFEKHNQLDAQIESVDAGRQHMSDIDLEHLKKEKLKLKDEAYAMIVDYKKTNNL